MKRRSFVTGAGAVLLAPQVLRAQPDARHYRIGAVSAGAGRATPHWAAFEQRLRDLGYVAGTSPSNSGMPRAGPSGCLTS
jgi:hypothetical protein